MGWCQAQIPTDIVVWLGIHREININMARFSKSDNVRVTRSKMLAQARAFSKHVLELTDAQKLEIRRLDRAGYNFKEIISLMNYSDVGMYHFKTKVRRETGINLRSTNRKLHGGEWTAYVPNAVGKYDNGAAWKPRQVIGND